MFVLWPFVPASNLHLSFSPLYSFLLKYVYSRKYVLRYVQLFATPWIVAHQAPLSMGFSQQEFWSELPFPPPGDLPDPGIKIQSLASPVLAGWFFTTSTTWVEGMASSYSLCMEFLTAYRPQCPPPSPSHLSGCPSAPVLSALFHASNLDW